MFDIVVAFRTTYYDENGEEIFNCSKITKDYIISGRFFIDFFSSVPFDEIVAGKIKYVEMLGLLKLLRLMRLRKIVKNLRLMEK